MTFDAIAGSFSITEAISRSDTSGFAVSSSTRIATTGSVGRFGEDSTRSREACDMEGLVIPITIGSMRA